MGGLSISLANSSIVWIGFYWATVSRRQKRKTEIGDYFCVGMVNNLNPSLTSQGYLEIMAG
jgi:hypothetical protein